MQKNTSLMYTSMEPKGIKKHDAFFFFLHDYKTCLCLSKKIFFILFIFSFSLYKKKGTQCGNTRVS
jgi:hypothetical protein